MYKNVDELLQKLDKLDEDTEPQWGSMTPQKMIEHLINTFKIANGKLETKCFSEEKKLPVLKKILMSDRPMPKGFDSPANRQVPEEYQYASLDEAKQSLISEVIDFYKFYEENPNAKTMNPTFGELTKSEWAQFHRKHLTHHLTQFGLID